MKEHKKALNKVVTIVVLTVIIVILSIALLISIRSKRVELPTQEVAVQEQIIGQVEKEIAKEYKFNKKIDVAGGRGNIHISNNPNNTYSIKGRILIEEVVEIKGVVRKVVREVNTKIVGPGYTLNYTDIPEMDTGSYKGKLTLYKVEISTDGVKEEEIETHNIEINIREGV